MNNYLRHILLPLGISILIFAGTCLMVPCSIPSLPQGIAWDKVVHFGMFFLLSAVSLFDYYWLYNGKPKSLRWFFWGFMVPVIYGGLIELMQKYFFPLRSAEWADFFADVMGSALALLLVWCLTKLNLNRA